MLFDVYFAEILSFGPASQSIGSSCFAAVHGIVQVGRYINCDLGVYFARYWLRVPVANPRLENEPLISKRHLL